MLFRLIALNGRFIHSCPALFYLRDALEKNLPAAAIDIRQFTINDPYYPTLREIGAGPPAALFFSAYIWNSLYIGRLIGDLVKLLPDTPLILGGPQAGALARELFPEALRRCTMVKGEIEGVDPSFYRDLAGKKLQRQYDCVKPGTFNSPYRPEDFEGSLKNRNIYYESSRGCPFGCTYCLSAAEKGVRHLALPQVQEEIRAVLRAGPKVVRFVDRTFNDRPARALDIWRFLAGQPGETLFHFEMAPDRFSEEMFAFLEQVEPGRFQFELGIQSTNPKTLAAINRKCDLVAAGENIRRLVHLETIHIHLDLILGLPHEDKASFARSFAEVFGLGPHYLQMGLLKILPDTPISRSIEEYGLVFCDKPPYEILANRWLTAEELAELFWFGECVEAFYNNRFFRSFWDCLRRTEADICAFFKGLLARCRRRNFFEQAHTQEQLSGLLLEHIQGHSDRELLREFLVFDWLRCGHRFLPPHLEEEPISHHRKTLRRRLPLKWETVYDYKSRDEFFKQGVFYPFSEQFLQELDVRPGAGPNYLCFLPARENTVFHFNRFIHVPAGDLQS